MAAHQSVISLATFFGRAKKVTSTGLAGVVRKQERRHRLQEKNSIED
jgi:hypothetical protein